MNKEKTLLASAAEVIDRSTCPRTALWLDELVSLEEKDPDLATKPVVYSLVGFLSSLEDRIATIEKILGIEMDLSLD